MARLRNRIVKADYWSDSDLLAMPRDMRETYRGLWALAEDSACLEDDPATWLSLLWPGALDRDITLDHMVVWRDALLASGKLAPYFVRNKRLLFIVPFHRHEHPRNPQINSLPLPSWLTWIPNEKDPRKGTYHPDWDALTTYLDALPKTEDGSYDPSYKPLYNPSYNGLSPARLPCPALSCPVLSCPTSKEEPVGEPVLASPTSDEADDFAGINFEDEEKTSPPPGDDDLRAAREKKRREENAHQRDEEKRVFDAWVEATERTSQTKFDDRRRAAIRKGLKMFGVEDCVAIVRGCGKSDFHMGRDPKAPGKNAAWSELTVIFRDAAHMEQFLALGKGSLGRAASPRIAFLMAMRDRVGDAGVKAYCTSDAEFEEVIRG